MLNLPRSKGRRRHLPSSCAAELVRVWMDDAIEYLWSMPDSCSLDVAARGEHTRKQLAEVSGRSSNGAAMEVVHATQLAAKALESLGDE